jgi:RHS repeat-associated protein
LPTSCHFTYAYLNNTGRIASIANPNGQSTVYTYQDSTTTGEPRLSEIKNLNASSAVISKFDYLYDADNQITSWTQQSDSSHPQNWALQYDNAGKLINASVTDTVTSALLHQYAYNYDATGNRTGEQIDGSVTTSSYNNLNQLTGQAAGGNMVFSGAVSKYSTVTVAGNPALLDVNNNFRGTANVTTGTNTVPVIATDVDGNVSTNRYQVIVPPGGGSSYTYDLNGNLMSDGSRTFSWDAKDEMTAIVYNTGPNAGNHTEFTYNGTGGRVKIVERTGTTIGAGTITSTKQFAGNEERDATNTATRRYFSQGEQRIISGVTTNYFYTRDHLGSIREVMDNNGTTVDARYSYDPFGRRTQVSGSLVCDFGFTGYYHHATSGLDLSATRAYDPNLGRFIQRDPAGEAGSGTNLYAYAGDNPICNVDPSGLDIIPMPGAPDFLFDTNWFPPETYSNVFTPMGPDPSFSCMDGPPMTNPFDQELMNGLANNPYAPPSPSDQWDPWNPVNPPPSYTPAQIQLGLSAATIPFGGEGFGIEAIGGASNLSKIEQIANDIIDYLGGSGRVIKNSDGDAIIMNDSQKIRFDINDPHGDAPHFHIEEQNPSGKWQDAGPDHRYYFDQ